jgi:hypothetical protein
MGCKGWIGPKQKEKAGGVKGNFANFQRNSNTSLNSTNQKLCSSMNATINSYGSLI